MDENDMRFTPGAAGVQPPGQQMPGGQQPLNVDASTLDTFVCSECGEHMFQNLVVVKRISVLNPVNTTGKEMFAPMQVLSCMNCGHVPNEFGGKAVPKKEEFVDNELQDKKMTDDTGPGLSE